MTKAVIVRSTLRRYALLGGACLSMPIALSRIGRQFSRRVSQPFELPFRTPPVLEPVHSDATTDYYNFAEAEKYGSGPRLARVIDIFQV